MDSILFVWDAHWHLLVCGWLCVACGILKRRSSSVTKRWDDETRDTLLQQMVSETLYSGMIQLMEIGAWTARSWTCGSGDWSGFGETWNSAEGRLLAMTKERCPTYQPCLAGHHIEKCQLSSPVTEQGVTREDRFCVYITGYLIPWLGEHECVPR